MRVPKYQAWTTKYDHKMYDVKTLYFEPNGEVRAILSDGTTEWGSLLVGAECELREYTGLKDKNGKEIYEGDIVQSIQPIFNRKEPERVVIEFADGILVYGCDPFVEIAGSGWQSATPDECEVIGNIYENPELLEAEV